MTDAADSTNGRISRRRLLAGVGGLGIAAGATAAGIAAWERSVSSDTAEAADVVVPFWGDHQAGIATPAQHYLHFASFDITAERKEDVAALLLKWSGAAARMSQGLPASSTGDLPAAPPNDTGEAIDLTAGRLTVTIGLGPGLFQKDGVDRFGLASRRPEALVDIPTFPKDQLEPLRTGGDLCVQACADDPQVAFHAVRNLTRIGRGSVVMRWSQLGFSRTSSTSKAQDTPRNLMGFKDGTNNMLAENTAEMEKFVWVGDEGPAWMRNGSYLVARRIRMTIEQWDRASLDDQERTIGRKKLSGSPLGGGKEHDVVDLDGKRPDGDPVLPVDAHIRGAAPAEHGGAKILRRGYSFTDGMDPYGQLEAGLFFIAFQRDARTQFIPIQQRLADNDALNEYIIHTGSAIFACPSGVQEGDWIGRKLFEA